MIYSDQHWLWSLYCSWGNFGQIKNLFAVCYIQVFFIVSSNFVFSVTSIFFIGQRGEGAEIQLYFMTNADFFKYPICNNLLRTLSLGEKNAFKLDLYNISIAVLSKNMSYSIYVKHCNQRSSNKLQFLFTVKYVRKTIFYRSYFLSLEPFILKPFI